MARGGWIVRLVRPTNNGFRQKGAYVSALRYPAHSWVLSAVGGSLWQSLSLAAHLDSGEPLPQPTVFNNQLRFRIPHSPDHDVRFRVSSH
jgi:hypothetical protein